MSIDSQEFGPYHFRVPIVLQAIAKYKQTANSKLKIVP